MTSRTGGAQVETYCVVDIEQSADSFHAYAVPEDVDIQPGDRVMIHEAPFAVPRGGSSRSVCRATVFRAGPLKRAWTRAVSVFALTELFEVGFASSEAGR